MPVGPAGAPPPAAPVAPATPRRDGDPRPAAASAPAPGDPRAAAYAPRGGAGAPDPSGRSGGLVDVFA